MKLGITLVLLGLVTASAPKYKIDAPLTKCSGPTRPRPSVYHLTDSQWNTYVRAIKKLNSGPRPTKWDQFSKLHTDIYPTIHQKASFLAWHRGFLYAMEKELQKIDPSIMIPFWDWTYHSQAPESDPVFDARRFGSDGGNNGGSCITSGSFKDMQIYFDGTSKSPKDHCIRRKFDKQGEAITAWLGPDLVNGVILNSNSFGELWSNIESGPHGVIHNGVGSDFKGHASPSDPLFFSHHAFVDKLWDDWAARNPNKKNEYAFDDSVKSVEDKLNEFSYSVKDMLDASKLCYSYPEDHYEKKAGGKVLNFAAAGGQPTVAETTKKPDNKKDQTIPTRSIKQDETKPSEPIKLEGINPTGSMDQSQSQSQSQISNQSGSNQSNRETSGNTSQSGDKTIKTTTTTTSTEGEDEGEIVDDDDDEEDDSEGEILEDDDDDDEEIEVVTTAPTTRAASDHQSDSQSSGNAIPSPSPASKPGSNIQGGLNFLAPQNLRSAFQQGVKGFNNLVKGGLRMITRRSGDMEMTAPESIDAPFDPSALQSDKSDESSPDEAQVETEPQPSSEANEQDQESDDEEVESPSAESSPIESSTNKAYSVAQVPAYDTKDPNPSSPPSTGSSVPLKRQLEPYQEVECDAPADQAQYDLEYVTAGVSTPLVYDRSDPIRVRVPTPLPVDFLKVMMYDVTLIRQLERSWALFTDKLNRDPNYVSPAALVNSHLFPKLPTATGPRKCHKRPPTLTPENYPTTPVPTPQPEPAKY